MTLISECDSRKPVWLVTLPAMCLPLLASFFYFVWFPGTLLGNSTYVTIKLFLLVWPILAVKLILRDRFLNETRKAERGRAMVAGIAFGLLAVALLVALMNWSPMANAVYGNADQITQRIDDLGVKNHYFLFAVFLSFFHAGLEEFFWRCFVFGQLRKVLNPGRAMILAAFGFALHHWVVLSQFVALPLALILGCLVGLGGAVWSYIYHRWNCLWGAWVSHVIVDIGLMWLGWEIMRSVQ